MARSSLPSLHQETRLHLDPALPNAVVDVQIPNYSTFSRLSPKRRRIDTSTVTYDEETFSKLHLASESSIHFRPGAGKKRSHLIPRAILWRILDNQKILELQAADLYHDDAYKTDLALTLRFSFSSAIWPGGVAFAEHEEESGHDALVVFVFTMSGELATLTLRKQHFAKPGLLQESYNEARTWCQIASPNAINHRTPFQLLAASERELWLSIAEGQLMRLERKGDDASDWRETSYIEGGWTGSIRGLVLWKGQKTIRHDNIDFTPDVTTSMALSPDGKYLWTVALDHTLRAWDVEKGTVVFRQDLSGDRTRDLQKPVTELLIPTQSRRVQILAGRRSDEYIVATFSSKIRAFKVWYIRDLENSEHGWDQMREDEELSLPLDVLGDAGVWNLEDFHFHESRGKNAWRIWILIRQGPLHQIFTLNFSFEGRVKDLTHEWQNDWTTVDPGLVSASALRKHDGNPLELSTALRQGDPRSLSELWTEYLFRPGRFTDAALETALAVFRRKIIGLAKENSSLSNTKSLKIRICETVGSSTRLQASDEDNTKNYDRFSMAIAKEWQTFYGLLEDLHKRREQTLALSVDPSEETAWVIRADFVSPIRVCSNMEILDHNRDLFANVQQNIHAETPLGRALPDIFEYGQLFYALGQFRDFLTPSFVYSFEYALQIRRLEDIKMDPKQAIESLYTESGFSGQISDDQYDQLSNLLLPYGGLAKLNSQILFEALEFLIEEAHGTKHKLHLTCYGTRMLLRSAGETLDLATELVTNALILVVFIMAEVEESDIPIEFHGYDLFRTYMAKAEQLRLLQWLSRSSINTRIAIEDQETADLSSRATVLPPSVVDMTVLECCFVSEWSTIKVPREPLPRLITYWARTFLLALPLNDKSSDVTSEVFGFLLKAGHHDLAYDFLPFLYSGPWVLYLSARLYLATGELDSALAHFKGAAEGLAVGKFIVPEELPGSKMLDFEERECFNDGYARYYQHVISLFEKARAYSYAVEVGQLALDYFKEEARPDKGLKTDLLSRLFASSHKTSRFELAYSALSQHSDLALRDSSLRVLVQTLLFSVKITTLLALPYSDDLARVTDAILLDLASKPTAPGSLSAEGSMSPYKILYAFRLSRNDLRGAATCLWERLQVLQQSQEAGFRGEDVDEEVAECYLALINILCLVKPDEAWILTRPPPINGEKQKRRVVTLDGIRRAWQEELDRVADIAAGRFALGLDWDSGDMGMEEVGRASLGTGGDSMEIDIV